MLDLYSELKKLLLKAHALSHQALETELRRLVARYELEEAQMFSEMETAFKGSLWNRELTDDEKKERDAFVSKIMDGKI